MDDKIFVKENTPQSGNSNLTPLLGVLAVVLLIVGVGGVIATFSNNSGQNTPAATQEETTNSENSEPTDIETVTPEDEDSATEETEVEPTPPAAETPVPPTTVDETVAGPPADTTKIHIYFPKTTGAETKLAPVLRDKPEQNLESTTINHIFTGPTAEERAQGFKLNWTLGRDSTCGANKTYKFTVSGGVFRLELCREISGGSEADLKAALETSIKEQGKYANMTIIKSNGDVL